MLSSKQCAGHVRGLPRHALATSHMHKCHLWQSLPTCHSLFTEQASQSSHVSQVSHVLEQLTLGPASEALVFKHVDLHLVLTTP